MIIVSCLSSCTLFGINQDETADNAYPPVWGYDFDIGYFSSIDPIIQNEKIIYSALDERRNDFMANSTLEAFNKESGEVIWKWDDTVDKPGDKFYFEGRHHIYANTLYISSGVDYAINLNTGLTEHFLNENKIGGQAFYGKANQIYTSFSNLENVLGLERSDLMVSDIGSYDWTLFLKGFTTDTTVIGYGQVLFDEENPNLVYLPFTEGYWGVQKVYTGLKVYDLSKEEIILEKKYSEIGETFAKDNLAIINDDKIFIPTRGKTICVNKNSGNLIWQKSVNGNTFASGILFPENNQLYVNTEFGVYCLNPETGNTIWSELNGEKEGNSSRMQYHNGVIYYIGGGMFHARDANTGEKLLFFEAPSFANDGGAFFQPVMTIDQQNDRIYTASYTHAYCYPTLR